MSESATKLFKSLIEDIINVFPEYEKRLMKYYSKTIESEDNEDPKLKEFLENIDEISDKIIEKDISLFNEDPVILQNVSFKIIWNSDISDQTKNSLWKYLQSFCIINIQNKSGKDKIQEVIKNIEANEKVKDKETLKNMKKMKKLNETFDINEIKNALESNPETVEKGMNEMDKMFENTGIGKLAKEITEELDIENMINNGGIQDLFSGGNMANIMQTISSKMSDNQDMNSDDLMKEATNICNSMQGNPLFSSLMGGMSGDLMGSLTGQNMPENPNQPVKNIKIGDKKHDPNKTRERLQKKLKEKTTVEKKD
tara:strand:+ start:410 stop:1345 length:936 start_codon:yes stop_codon:yes gene_type:complete